MRDRTIVGVWAVGLMVAAAVYLAGPDRVLGQVFDAADHLADALQDSLAHLGGQAYDLARALALACFGVFFALSMVAAARGRAARGLLLVITVLFLLLVWRQGPAATMHWWLAFLLAVAGAARMTRILRDAPLPARGKERL